MAISTMTSLRKVSPIASSCAVLLDHRLAFNIPGTPLIEPAWASIEPSIGNVTHGVLYKLSQADFETVRSTEG